MFGVKISDSRLKQIRKFFGIVLSVETVIYILLRYFYSIYYIKGFPTLYLIAFNIFGILCLYLIKYIHPETYNKVQEVAPKIEELTQVVIPPEISKMVELLIELMTPFSEKILSLPGNKLVPAIINAAFTQPTPSIPGRHITKEDLPLLERARRYVLFATGIYGSKSSQDIIMNPQNYSYKDIVNGFFNDEYSHSASLQFFCNITHVPQEDILFKLFTSPTILTQSGAEIHSPPLFIVRDKETKSIVVVCRGTNSVNDALIDVCEQPLVDENGFFHEGMGLMALSYINSKRINKVLKKAFLDNPDYNLYSVGHSLGASVACLLCINWRKRNMYMDHDPRCICFAPPPCISKTYKMKGEDFIYSFVNEDDIVPRCSADCVHVFAEHVYLCSEHDKLEDMDIQAIHSLYNNKTEKYTPDTVVTANYIMPGMVYYMNDGLINDETYYQYENSKQQLYQLIKEFKFTDFINHYRNLEQKPSIKIFRGIEMPHGFRIYPWLINNHSILEYDTMVNNCYKLFTNQELIPENEESTAEKWRQKMIKSLDSDRIGIQAHLEEQLLSIPKSKNNQPKKRQNKNKNKKSKKA